MEDERYSVGDRDLYDVTYEVGSRDNYQDREDDED